MDPFVLVHGAWHGAWCWDATIAAMGRRGHRAYAPQLSGMQEGDPGAVGLSDHVADVSRYIVQQGLMDATLVGANAAAALLPMVFESIPNRIDGIILLDGLVPLPGESVLDAAEMILPGSKARWERDAETTGFRALPPDDSLLDWMLADVPEPGRSEARVRMRPHPYRSITEPARYSRFPSAPPYRAYIRCQRTPLTNTGARMAQRAQAELYPLAAGHDAMLSVPDVLADRLLEIVNGWNAGDIT